MSDDPGGSTVVLASDLDKTMHIEIEPAIHYWGTPVALLSTLNPDQTVNVAPMSSIWWLGWSAMLGLDASSKTVENLQRERQCVINLASEATAPAVNRLAQTTGTSSVPLHKKLLGYRHVPNKLEHAGLTASASVVVRPPRIDECPVQLEARVVAIRPFAKSDQRMAVPACAVEVQIQKVHVEKSLLASADHVDATAWKPLFMSFRHLFVRGPQLGPSRLASGEESAYAPWKRGGLTKLAAKVWGAMAEHRYGIEEVDDDVL